MIAEAAVVQASTYTLCKTGTPEGKKFLRKIIRDNSNCRYREDWSVRASLETEWRLEFRRTINGEIGDPEKVITVMTDEKVSVNYQSGDKKSFEDSQAVTILPCRYISLSGSDVKTLCFMMLQDGFRISAEASSGSTSSSKHGISVYTLRVKTQQLCGTVEIGHHSMAVNGNRVISGSVEI